MKTLSQIIRAEIPANGAIPFARFMELALYCPEYGYYEQQTDTVGRRGDFITSVSTGELFGQLLAFQFADWLEEIKLHNPRCSTLNLIEAGAHEGQLANDILSWLSVHRPKLFSGIKYFIIEPSGRRPLWQKEKLRQFGSQVYWAADFKKLLSVTGETSVNGIIFSNELLDAFPVHRYGWEVPGKSWFEWGVAVEADRFIWSKIPCPAKKLPSSMLGLPSELLEVLPDNYTVEMSPAAENWWREAAGILSYGKLLAIDYGFASGEQFSPGRTNGTLRSYFRHHVGDDLLANPGEQDLTAHVNFSAIQNAGETAGMTTENFCTQPQFLARILEKAVHEKSFVEWNARRARQFQTLTHPEHLGRAFRVLVQSRRNS